MQTKSIRNDERREHRPAHIIWNDLKLSFHTALPRNLLTRFAIAMAHASSFPAPMAHGHQESISFIPPGPKCRLPLSSECVGHDGTGRMHCLEYLRDCWASTRSWNGFSPVVVSHDCEGKSTGVGICLSRTKVIEQDFSCRSPLPLPEPLPVKVDVGLALNVSTWVSNSFSAVPPPSDVAQVPL